VSHGVHLGIRLGNSDWVKQGREYYAANDQRCPFCQQPTEATLAEKLNEYFDETFIQETQTVAELASKYSHAAERLKKGLDAILSSECQFLDKDKLKSEREVPISLMTI
jgi:wobble nucleotide-excising tRNase